MFTGVVRSVGKIIDVRNNRNNKELTISHHLSRELKVGDSLNTNGVCLTIIATNSNEVKVQAVKETLRKSNLRLLQRGDFVNLEPSLQVEDGLEGHILQGHVDASMSIKALYQQKSHHVLTLQVPDKYSDLLVEKGSIGIDGISLTVAEISGLKVKVVIIPHTYENTTLKFKHPGSEVNIEFDILGKYVKRITGTS